MRTHKIAAIPADGIGPEVIGAGLEVLAELAAGREGGRFGGAVRAMLARNPESFATFLEHVAEDKRGEFIKDLGRTMAASNPEAVLEAVVTAVTNVVSP